MDARLIPINAFIAMVSPQATSWPNPLYGIGYGLEGLEVPVNVDGGRVVVDCVAFDAQSNRFLLAESKSGSNIEAEQARRYGDADPKDLIRLIGVTIVRPGDQALAVLYLCLADSIERIRTGLEAAGCDYPVLAIGNDAISLDGRSAADSRLDAAFSAPITVPGPPPGVISVDVESDDEEFDGVVSASIVAEVTQGHDLIPCPELASRAIRHLHIYGTGHRNRLVERVTAAAQRFCEAASDSFEFRPRTQTRDYALVKVTDSPERSDPRGRTQRYQALKGKLTGAPTPAAFDQQASLFDEIDLAAELELADTGDTDANGPYEEDQ